MLCGIVAVVLCSQLHVAQASFYVDKHTASGERYSRTAYTAAHRTLPFGTKVRVCRGKRCVVARVNDRGPYVRGRALDLSIAAARAIGLTKRMGVSRVVWAVVGPSKMKASHRHRMYARAKSNRGRRHQFRLVARARHWGSFKYYPVRRSGLSG